MNVKIDLKTGETFEQCILICCYQDMNSSLDHSFIDTSLWRLLSNHLDEISPMSKHSLPLSTNSEMENLTCIVPYLYTNNN